MDWNAQIDREVKELDGIVALLLSLAGLAERAASATLPVRWLTLMFLRLADAVATEFVARSTGGAARGIWSAQRMSIHHGSHPADAIDLALSLSRLAAAVAGMVAQLRRQAFLHRAHRSGGKSLDRRPRYEIPAAFGMTVPQAGHPDTS
jgi:hypothetical protein